MASAVQEIKLGPSRASPIGRRRDVAQRFRTGASPRARSRGGVPPLSLQRPRVGRYWLVGDVRNTPGRSMFVRLKGSKPAAAGPANGPTPPLANMATCST